MTMFNFAEFLVNREHRYEHSINRLKRSEYVYGPDQWNHEYLDKLKQLHLKHASGPPSRVKPYHTMAPDPVSKQKYGWAKGLFIVEEDHQC